MSIEKHDWAVSGNLFAQINQDSIISNTSKDSKMFNVT